MPHMGASRHGFLIPYLLSREGAAVLYHFRKGVKKLSQEIVPDRSHVSVHLLYDYIVMLK